METEASVIGISLRLRFAVRSSINDIVAIDGVVPEDEDMVGNEEDPLNAEFDDLLGSHPCLGQNDLGQVLLYSVLGLHEFACDDCIALLLQMHVERCHSLLLTISLHLFEQLVVSLIIIFVLR